MIDRFKLHVDLYLAGRHHHQKKVLLFDFLSSDRNVGLPRARNFISLQRAESENVQILLEKKKRIIWSNLMQLRSMKPSKPSSGYNIFYKFESNRARNRERARKMYVSQSSQYNSKYGNAPNITRLIGGKWKDMSPHTQSLFIVLGRNELEIYNVRKALWAANEHTSLGGKKKEGKDGVHSGTFLPKKKVPFDTNRQLVFFLY